MGVVPHLLLEGYVSSYLPYVLHDEINLILLGADGMVVLGGEVHSGDRVYVHVGSDDLMLHQPLEIAEEPLV